MTALTIPDDAPGPFRDAVARLAARTVRPEIAVAQVPAPSRAAPHAVAMSAEVVLFDEDLAVGRFILLHDPAGQEAWSGTHRVVTFVRAAMETDLGTDPMLAEIGWAWTREALETVGAAHHAHAGTVTRTVSESFGDLAGRDPVVELEIRSSWTPDGDIGPHLDAWTTLLGTVSGLPALPAGVSVLPRRR